MKVNDDEPAGLCCSFCERSADEVHELTRSAVDESIAICDRCIREFFRQLPPEPEAAESPETA
jgi:ClpX C4-type zinc finger